MALIATSTQRAFLASTCRFATVTEVRRSLVGELGFYTLRDSLVECFGQGFDIGGGFILVNVDDKVY